MNFKRINNITGCVICIVACAVYLLTMEASGSLWDCGEFASSAFKLQVPHSPGAPLFVLIGRLFMAPFDGHPANAATGINTMSALASGFTILFLFWSITYYAKRILTRDGSELTNDKIFGIMAAGVVGALAYTFSDTFWYSAVEGEVYALSSFFTALLFWLILKWEQNVIDEKLQGINGHFTKADRWLVLLLFLMGLSIGVHLLNLLVIPAVVMVYYFNRYKLTKWGPLFAFIIGCAITGFVQKALIQWTIGFAGSFDVFFVNSLHTPYFTGFAFFFLLIVVIVYFIFRLADNKNWNLLKLSLWGFIFMLFGCFASYFTTLVRSNANVPLDMGEVDNPINLMSYLSREQYGDWPILYGPDFTAGNVAGNEYRPDYQSEATYIKSNGVYEKKGRKQSGITYHSEDMHLFPRMWDASNDVGRADYYANWAGINKDKEGHYDRTPSVGENIAFGFQYQVNWMYMRYFLWNFAGKQNDNQGVDMSNVRDGNWKTGISFIDKILLGDQDKLPDSLKKNKANNKLYCLPLILGILGFIYHVAKKKNDALIVGLGFFFTGLAIEFYLNMAGLQPRERDYAFVGSFYFFALWIGLGVLYLCDLANKYIQNKMAANALVAAVCFLAVPVIMANQEWDDHDRSQKTMAPDLAKDYLESCAPNAILVTFGDNDTYPLWFAQEVQGVRRDIRVINSSLLGTDWYINQLRYKVNQSDAIDPLWTADQIAGANRDVVYYSPTPGVDANKPMDLYTMMKDYAGSDDPSKTKTADDGSTTYNFFPTKNVTVPVDINEVKQNGTVTATDSVVSQLSFAITKNYLQKNDAAILNMIAANHWKRPIYFTSQDAGGLGFQNYIRQDGLSYRLVPVLKSEVNRDWVYDKMMNKFAFGGADKKGTYFDEENRRHLNSIRLAYAQASLNLATNNKKEQAKQMLNKCDSMMLDDNFPYGMVSRGQQHDYFSFLMLQASYAAGDSVLATKITKSLKKDLEQQLTYYASLDDNKQDVFARDGQMAKQLLQEMERLETQFKNPAALLPSGEAPQTINAKPVTPAKPPVLPAKKK